MVVVVITNQSWEESGLPEGSSRRLNLNTCHHTFYFVKLQLDIKLTLHLTLRLHYVCWFIQNHNIKFFLIYNLKLPSVIRRRNYFRSLLNFWNSVPLIQNTPSPKKSLPSPCLNPPYADVWLIAQ